MPIYLEEYPDGVTKRSGASFRYWLSAKTGDRLNEQQANADFLRQPGSG